MEITRLARALMALEAAAARVGHLLPDSEEGLQQVVASFAPLRPKSYSTTRWSAFWLAWLRECADRLPAQD